MPKSRWCSDGAPGPGLRELKFGRLELKKQLAEEFVAAARSWLDELTEKRPVAFDYDLALDDDEYLSASLSGLIELSQRQAGTDANEAPGAESEQGPTSEAELQAVIAAAFNSDDWLPADSLRRNFLFYAVVVRTSDRESIGFIKQSGPQRLAKAGGWLTAFDGSLDTFDKPILVVEPDVDLILHGDNVAILRPIAFERLCADLELSNALVPDHADTVSKALPLADGARDVIVASCRARKRSAVILRTLSSFSEEQWARRTVEGIRSVLQRRGLTEDEFISSNGELVATENNVKELLEVLTSKYYTSDFDEEERAADRSRLRKS